MTYLANAYGNNSELYPSEDSRRRAKIDCMLYFDGNLYNQASDFFVRTLKQMKNETKLLFLFQFPILFRGGSPNDDLKTALVDGLGNLEAILKRHKFVSGPELSIADHAACLTLTCIQLWDMNNQISLSQFPKIQEWYSTCESAIPKFDELCRKPIQTLVEFVKSGALSGQQNGTQEEEDDK